MVVQALSISLSAGIRSFRPVGTTFMEVPQGFSLPFRLV